MAPGTNTGAAHPVSSTGQKIEDVMEKKIVSDATAYIRSYTSKRGRNAPMAELGVTESRSFTADEALKDIEDAANAFTKPNATRFLVDAQGVQMHIVDPPKSAKIAYPLSTYSYIIFPQQTQYATELRHIVYWTVLLPTT